jgi:hypothetical protein
LYIKNIIKVIQNCASKDAVVLDKRSQKRNQRTNSIYVLYDGNNSDKMQIMVGHFTP